MSWTLTDDVDEYAQHVRPLLEAQPMVDTIALTILDRFEGGGSRWRDAAGDGWSSEGEP